MSAPRPATFADIRGHERALGVLRRSVAAGRVHHAYLFMGPGGVGKHRAARAFAALVNCLSPTGEGATLDACGACVSCLKLAGGNHPDYREVTADGRFIKIDQVRELHAVTRFRPYEAKRRVVLIDGAETMREEAANAILKTLEEPRGDTLFVLVTANPQQLLTTVISRCQPLRFGPLSADDVAALLAERGVDGQQADVAARLGGGSVGGALHVLESGVWERRADVAERLAGLKDGGSGALLEWAQALGQGDELSDVIEVFRSLARDAVLLAAGANERRLVNPDLRAAIERYAAGRTLPQLLGAVERLGEAEWMLKGNVNARLVAETLLLALSDAPERPLAPGLAA